MISKKNLMLALIAIGSVFSALSIGCTAPVQQTMDLEADIYDALGNPLTTYFDYYLNIATTDGYSLTYFNGGQQTDSNGVWTYSEGNLMFYTDPNGQQCDNTCVTWDDYGCTEYATDCFDTSDVYNLDTNMIASSAAQIGIDTGTSYLLYNSSVKLASFTPDAVTFVQHDEFDTNIIVTGSPGGSVGSTGAVQVVAADQVKGHLGHAASQVVARKAPVKVEISSLSSAQMDKVIKSRTAILSMKKKYAAAAAPAAK